jgi:hypothetical protein
LRIMNFHVHSEAPPNGQHHDRRQKGPAGHENAPEDKHGNASPAPLAPKSNAGSQPPDAKANCHPGKRVPEMSEFPHGPRIVPQRKGTAEEGERTEDDYLAGSIFHLLGAVFCAVHWRSPRGVLLLILP